MKNCLHYWRALAVVLGFLVLSGCGGTGEPAADNSNDDSSTKLEEQPRQQTPITRKEIDDTTQDSAPETTPEPREVLISGQITYDRVLFAERFYQGLDYNNTERLPARAVVVELLDSAQQLLASTETDDQGFYQFTADPDTALRIQVHARLRDSANAKWDIEVLDNTADNGLYVLEGAIANSGLQKQQTRNLHAPSGWHHDGYAGDRSAAPFAILDSIYDAILAVEDAAPTSALPQLAVYWSSNNIAIAGSLRQGHIGTSFFNAREPAIYLLGAANNDSDEYDRGVIQHEFGHFIEHQLGRSESVGGGHSQSSRLDMRVAFGEAWGNAFAGMVSGDPVYRDSLGFNQSQGFSIDVSARHRHNNGWFSQASIQAILYALYDSSKAEYAVEMGLPPILETLSSNSYRNFDGMASIYPFLTQLKALHPSNSGNIDQLAESFEIFGKGWYGEGERNDGGSQVVLPLYHHARLGETVNVCSDSQFRDSNGMDVRRFIHISLPSTRSYNIRAIKTSGLAQANPQLKLFRQGTLVDSVLNGTPDHEDALRYLQAGRYIVEVYEQSNADGVSNNGGYVCFDVTIE